MRVAAVQLECSADRARNLERAAELVGQAVAQGAELVALPELFASLGPGAAMRAAAEPVDGPTFGWASELATRHGIWLQAGSIVERADSGRLFNTALLVDPAGVRAAVYRKVHLFDVTVEGAGTRESEVFSAGDQLVTVDLDGGRVGLTTCYDLRFPELFRSLALRRVAIVLMPSAFTAATGEPHWEPLVRARAIENQLFVVAPDQCGTSPDGIARHGRSLIVDPWGTVLADAGEREGVVVADLDLTMVERVRRVLPNLANRRPSAYDL